MNKYKASVLLVDDDSLARVGILSLIPFAEHGFDIVAEADNGSRALELALKLKPDIILTDIIMPGLNGIELIRACKEHRLPSQFIVLSSHDDFKYVKEALKEGAADYILKTELEKESLIALLNKTAEKKPIFRAGDYSNAELSRILLTNEHDSFIKTHLYGSSSLDEAAFEQARHIFSRAANPLFCLVITITGSKGEALSEQDVRRLELPAKNAFEEIIRKTEGAACSYLGGRSFFIYSPLELAIVNPQEFKKQLRILTRQFSHVCLYMLNVSARIGVSKIHPSLHLLPKAYHEAEEAAKQALLDREDVVFYYDLPEKSGESADFVSAEQDIAALREALHGFNQKLLETCFDALSRKINKNALWQQGHLQGLCFNMLFVVNNFLQTVNVDPKTFWQGSSSSAYPQEEQIQLLATREDVVLWCTDLKEKLFAILSSAEKNIRVIVDAKTFITRHYAENISLENVASKTGLSPTYLSKQFAKLTGMKFIDFVTQVRIEKAKELLRNSAFKIFAVAEMVGYDNTTYFSFLFKKETGLSPQEYRQLYFSDVPAEKADEKTK